MNEGDGLAHLWRPPEQEPLLADAEVHVWRVSLNQQHPRVQSLFRLLAAEEKERAERFYFQKDRDHFIVARGALRTILGLYLEVEPDQLRFRYAAYGKPYLEENGCDGLRFNLSHSHGLALLAVTRGREVGVDIEMVRQDVVEEQIAERFFSPREVSVLRSLPAEQQPEAFFNCWTRKEAYIKARGEGLTLPLDMFDVSLAPGEPAALLETRIDPGEIFRWHMMELAPGAGFRAALVVERRDWSLKCWQWPDGLSRDDFGGQRGLAKPPP
jgi:4'-phosphopantetheinyl transferase